MFDSLTISSFFGTQGVALAVAGFVIVLLLRKTAKKSQLPLPPGPPPKPIVGNYFDMPKKEGWFIPETYRQISKSVDSPIISVWLFGLHVVIVNTAEAARDLFQTRGHIYSARPELNMLHKIARLDWFISLMQPGERWKHTRKTMVTNYKQNDYRNISTNSTHTMMRALLVTPDKFLDHFRRMNTATTMAVVYGIDMEDGKNEHFVDVGKGMMHAIWDGTSRAALAFDSLPAFFSSWPNLLLGLGYTRNPGHDMEEVPFKAVQERVAAGTAKPSIVTNMLNKAQTKEEENLAKLTGANIYLSGANKVNAPLGAFVRAMIAYPEVQLRAQKELDTVLDGNRLPSFSDAPSLPFVDAIVKEVLRWHVVAPFATAHRAGQDDVYKGYSIPKGTVVVGNAWAILNDEAEFPEPGKFKPERWFDRPTGDFPFAAFGFGPRICPGIPFSRDMMWITIASILATFTIEPVAGVDGKPMVPRDAEDWTYTLFSYPLPFQAKFMPRSEAAKQLIHATAAEEPLTSA